MKMNRQLLPLTSLRFVAAFLVVLQHFQLYLVGGGVAVEFFFSLSGFILVYGYSKTFESLDAGSIWRFFAMRIARLYPVYIVTFLTAAALWIGAVWPFSGWEVARSVFALQSYAPIGGAVFSFNGPSWSVADEFFFYLMFPFIAWGIARSGIGRHSGRLVAAWAVLLALRIMIASRLPSPLGDLSNSWWFAYISPYFRITGFISGMLVGYWFLLNPSLKGGRALWTAIEVASLVVMAPLAFQMASHSPEAMADGIVYAPGIAMALVAFGLQRGMLSAILSIRPLVHLGEISYSVYMIQDTVITWTSKSLASDFWGLQMHSWHIRAQVGLILIILALSDILFRYVEKPCRDYAKKRLAARRVIPCTETSTSGLPQASR